MDLSMLDPFSPSTGADPAAPQNSNIGGNWSQALGDPSVRTALLQFGISMLQPPSFGDTFGSQVGRAVGSAGESVQRGVEDTRKQQESTSKMDLQEAQAGAAESRAATAQARTETAAAGLDLKRQQLDQAQERIGLTRLLGEQRRRIDASNSYTRYLVQAAQDQFTSGKRPESREEFYTRSGYGDLLGNSSAGGVDPTELAAQARDAIARGGNAAAIRARYREKTGQDLP